MTEFTAAILVPYNDANLVVKDGVTYILLDVDDVQKAFASGAKKSKFRGGADLQREILKVVADSPGASRQDIIEKLSELGVVDTESALGHALSNLKRGNHIENRGTRKFPKWHIKS